VSDGSLLRTARDGAQRFARTTGADVAQLADVFWQVAHRQVKDALSGLRERAGRPPGADGETDRRPPR
jgi:hypothetical protein